VAGSAGGTEPVVTPPGSSIARRVKRRSRGRKSGVWFPIVCGVCLVAGIGWLYLSLGPTITGKKFAYAITQQSMPPKIVDSSLITVSPEARKTVLNYFQENTERLRSDLAETEFSATNAGLQIRVLTGIKTRFIRFPINEDLREWYDAHYDALAESRSKALKKSLKSFFTDWEIAIRNQQGVEDFIVYRDTVGLAASVNGLGYNVSAKVGQTLYPCVYEDEGGLYFLLPETTKKFKIVGLRINGKKTHFDGEYDVTVKPASS